MWNENGEMQGRKMNWPYVKILYKHILETDGTGTNERATNGEFAWIIIYSI